MTIPVTSRAAAAFAVSLCVAASVHGTSAGGEFHMPVADAFEIASGGVVATGRIAAGSVAVGDRICLRSAEVGTREVEVLGMEKFQQLVDSAASGETIGIMVSGVEAGDVAAGDDLRGSCN